MLDGAWLTGHLEQLDCDVWQELLSERAVSGPSEDALSWNGIQISARRMRMFSRDFSELSIDARREGAIWKAQLDGTEIAGNVEWSSESKGTLTGRFARLQLPAPTAELEAPGSGAQQGKDLPTVDITAADFRMGARQLGNLTLRASPSGADWNIERLDLVSPDGNLNVTGVWKAWAVNPRTQVDVKLDVADIGRFF